MKFRPIVALVLSGLLLAATSALAGGWTQKQGKGYYKVEARAIRATRMYDPDGERISIPTYGEYTGSFYGEHGLSDNITLIAQLPFIKRLTINRQVGRSSGVEYSPALSRTGIGDAELGLRYGLAQDGPSVLAASLLIGIPTGLSNADDGLSTGDGEFNAIASIEAGHSFHPLPLYATASLGFNSRRNGYSDEARWGVELGGSPAGDLQLSARMSAIHPLKNGTADTPSRAGINANNQQYIAYGSTIGYRVTETIHLSASIESAFGARNVPAAPTISLGIALVR